jgi:Fic family protein
MKRALQGRYVTITTAGEAVRAFVPAPLPPTPPVEWTPELRNRFDEALLAVGQLEGVSSLVPDPALFVYGFVRKEAVLSSMIEGTRSTLTDLLLHEAEEQPGVPLDDVREVSSYVAALEHGLARLREGFPLSSRLIREVHRVLMTGARGGSQDPGEFRRSQNWIGGTRPGNAVFVPPPATEVAECMGQLERFLHDDPAPTSPLLKAALSHLQFETIHPFLDGNGRVGRLLITLILCHDGALSQPLLYPSLYLKQHRQEYYRLLNEVRLSGNWEAWLEFFAEAMQAAATEARESARRIVGRLETDRLAIAGLGRASTSARRVHQALQRRPILTAAQVGEQTGYSPATVYKALTHLQELGVVEELTARRRGRIFAYMPYIAILSEGTEPFSRSPYS